MKKSILAFQTLITISIAFTANANATIDFPSIPKRPTLKNLQNSLSNIPIYKYKKSSIMPENTANTDLEDINTISGTLIDSHKKSFKVKPDILFMNSIDSAIETNLSLKYLDINELKIIAVDNMQNTILINLEPGNKNDTIVQISGYSLKPDNISVNQIVDKLISTLSEKSKK